VVEKPKVVSIRFLFEGRVLTSCHTCVVDNDVGVVDEGGDWCIKHFGVLSVEYGCGLIIYHVNPAIC